MNDLSLICSNDETNPTRRRGAQPGRRQTGNTNALLHGLYSQRFNPRRLQSLLTQPPAPQDAAPNAPGSSLLRHLAILRATIEDLAQAASEGRGAAIPLLLHAIRSHATRSHATLTALSHSLEHPNARRLSNNPEGHTKCAACGAWWQNSYLSPKDSAIAALAPELPPRMLRRTSICIFHGAGGNRHGQLP